MRKGNMVLEQPILWIIIIIAGFLIAWGLFRLIKAGGERGLAAVFGG